MSKIETYSVKDPSQMHISTKAESPSKRFSAIDSNGNGSISFSEAKKWVKANRAGAALKSKNIKTEFNIVDTNNNGKIEPSEFDSELK